MEPSQLPPLWLESRGPSGGAGPNDCSGWFRALDVAGRRPWADRVPRRALRTDVERAGATSTRPRASVGIAPAEYIQAQIRGSWPPSGPAASMAIAQDADEADQRACRRPRAVVYEPTASHSFPAARVKIARPRQGAELSNVWRDDDRLTLGVAAVVLGKTIRPRYRVCFALSKGVAPRTRRRFPVRCGTQQRPPMGPQRSLVSWDIRYRVGRRAADTGRGRCDANCPRHVHAYGVPIALRAEIPTGGH